MTLRWEPGARFTVVAEDGRSFEVHEECASVVVTEASGKTVVMPTPQRRYWTSGTAVMLLPDGRFQVLQADPPAFCRRAG